MKNIHVLYVAFLVLLIGAITFAFYKMQPSESQGNAEDILTSSQQGIDSGDTANIETPPSEPTSENPPDQGDVRNQPAYLINAITRHGQHLLGVDYVMVFQGEEAIQAQIEDGVCSEESTCQVPQGGYIRNNNPHFRSYEISTTTPLVIEVSGALQSAATSKGLDTASLSFDDLKEVLPSMPQYVPSEFPFKEAKTFVYIDIRGGGVTKIREP